MHCQPYNLEFRAAKPEDTAECMVVRSRTRQNAASQEWLRSIGITRESWARNIRSGALEGHVCVADGNIVGFCFGVRETGEIQVIALLPAYEDRGIGRVLLDMTCEGLASLGHDSLFLSCNHNPASRSYGFYRHLGWRSTGSFDQYGDEILEMQP